MVGIKRICGDYANSTRIYGGVYADIDLIPHIIISIDTCTETDASFYSCIAVDNRSIFQAFMVLKEKNCALMLAFLLSLTHNRPFLQANGPTYDMYNVLQYNIKEHIRPNVRYTLDTIRVPIHIGKHTTSNTKTVELFYFPSVPNMRYDIKIISAHKDNFEMTISNNILSVQCTTSPYWTCDLSCEIILYESTSIYLFKENLRSGEHYVHAYVTYRGTRMLTCHDPEYVRNNNRSWGDCVNIKQTNYHRKISIVAMFQNEGSFIPIWCTMWDSIEKYLEIHYQNISLEFYIYEDGSTDGTCHQLKSFIENHLLKIERENYWV